MTDELKHTVPAAQTPPPAGEPLDTTVARVVRWLEGFTDDNGVNHPGVIAMVTEMYEEAKLRRERREAFVRAVTSGGVLAATGVGVAWLKDHLKL